MPNVHFNQFPAVKLAELGLTRTHTISKVQIGIVYRYPIRIMAQHQQATLTGEKDPTTSNQENLTIEE